MRPVILASGSPRRRELLSLIVDHFDIIPADVDETIDETKPLDREIERLSYKKAEAVFHEHPEAVVIGSDTIVTIDGKILGKPSSKEEAREMLRTLSGQIHTVITAVSILTREESETFSIKSEVQFENLEECEIIAYVDSNEPLDKAGAYAIQGDGAKFVKAIRGDYYAIIGLPVSELYQRLKKYAGVV